MLSEEIQPNVLVIDDEEAMRDSCRQILIKEGYTVREAIDGTSGLKIVREWKPDLVLLDLKMPGISGQEVLEHICETGESVATVVTTGYATISAAIDAIRSGAYDFLPKPFTPDELRSVVERTLKRRRDCLEAMAANKEKSEAVRYFISMIRHEVVTPLKDVRRKINNIENDLPRPVSPSIKEHLAYCSTTLERVGRMIEKWQGILQVDLKKNR